MGDDLIIRFRAEINDDRTEGYEEFNRHGDEGQHDDKVFNDVPGIGRNQDIGQIPVGNHDDAESRDDHGFSKDHTRRNLHEQFFPLGRDEDQEGNEGYAIKQIIDQGRFRNAESH